MINSIFKEKYLELIENANSIILGMDIDGNITFFNEFAQKFFGFPEAEILGKNVIGTIVPPADFTGQDLKAMIQDIMASPQKYINNENENITRDGRHVWISWTNKPILDQAGKLQEVLSIGNDISRLKKAELELAKAKELAEAASHIGTVICSPDWGIKAINSVAKRYFHLETAETSSLDMLAIMLQGYQASISKEQINDFTIIRQTFELMRPETENNKALYLQVNREVVKGPEQGVGSLVLSIQDITDQKKEELLKQDFLGLISHKLRTPIAAILQSSLLLQEDYSDSHKALINGIVEEAVRLNGLINNLLNFVMINNQNITAAKESISVAEYLPQLVQPLIKAVKDKTVNLKIDCPDKNLVLSMNQIFFDLVISNLVDNSLKFNDKATIEINLSVKKEDNRICLMISDNGPGIAVEEQDKVFEKFYQVEKCFTGNVCGAGLGLPLVKKIVTAYGGTIELKSDIGKGTTFRIALPV